MKSSLSMALCIPFYNSDFTFFDRIREVNELISNECKIIILNDGSNPIYDSYFNNLQKINSISILKHKKNEGIAQARNNLVYSNKFNYIMWLDSDDTISPNRIREVKKFILKNPNSSMFLNWSKFKNADKTTKILFTNKKNIAGSALAFRNVIQTSSVTINADVMRENRIFFNEDCTPSEDFDVWSKLISYGDLTVVPKICSTIIVNSKGASSLMREHQAKISLETRILQISKISKNSICRESIKRFLIIIDLNQINTKSDNYKKDLIILSEFIIDFMKTTKKKDYYYIFNWFLWEHLRVNFKCSNSIYHLRILSKNKLLAYLPAYLLDRVRIYLIDRVNNIKNYLIKKFFYNYLFE